MNKDYRLTNQYLNDAFISPFALLSRAINLARETIRSGNPILVETGILNQAHQVLSKIGREVE